jgi:prepilin-type N-terminal cleavage/methylation domain-containing protein
MKNRKCGKMVQPKRTSVYFLSPISSNHFGYTLVELLVVMALISIIVLISFTSLDSGNQREQTRAGADNLRTDLKSQQENALDNKVSSSGDPAGYYGILFGPSLPFISYSVVRLEKYPTPKAFDCTQPNCNTTVLSTYTFNGSATISSVSPGNLRAIFFTETTSIPVFYKSSGLTSGPVTVTVSGLGNNIGVSVSNAGAIAADSSFLGRTFFDSGSLAKIVSGINGGRL